MILSFSPFLSDKEDPKRLAAAAPITDTIVIDEPPPQEIDPAAKSQKASKKPTKKVVSVRHSGRLQKASDAAATLEAHQSIGSFDDVRAHTIIFTSTFACLYSRLICWIESDEEICRLGQ
jgi:hypothetical protein